MAFFLPNFLVAYGDRRFYATLLVTLRIAIVDIPGKLDSTSNRGGRGTSPSIVFLSSICLEVQQLPRSGMYFRP